MGTFIIYTQNCYNLFNVTSYTNILFVHGTFTVITFPEIKINRWGWYEWPANRGFITLDVNASMSNSTEIRTKKQINAYHKRQCFEVRSMEMVNDAVSTADLKQCQKDEG
jgi:hypothetical protein